MAAKKKQALYTLAGSVTMSAAQTYTEATLVTNLAIADRYGMSIQRVTFEHTNFSVSEPRSMVLLTEAQTAMKHIHNEDVICKSSNVSHITTTGGFAISLMDMQTFVPGIVIAQKELYLGIYTDDDDVLAGTGSIRVEYELIKLSDSELIALATR